MPDHQYAPGILIRHPPGDASFIARTTRSLQKIAGCGSGAALMAALQGNFNNLGNRTVIRQFGVSMCAGGGGAALTLLANAVLNGAGGPAGVGAEIDACLTAEGHANDHAWLAARINATPVYALNGPVSAAPSNLGVTAAHVTGWIANATWPAPFAGPAVESLANALLTALQTGARTRPGLGVASLVSWEPQGQSITTTTGVVVQRSKSIGLAHELVHAMYNGAGQQMGIDNAHHSTALYEYMCVGLGVWANEPISENAIRAQWHGVVSHTVLRRNVLYPVTPARPAY